jgi:GTP-binding protein HflX
MGIEHHDPSKPLRESAILVGVCVGRTTMEEATDHLDELERLADTAQANVIGRFIQKMPKFNPATLIGKGKLREIKEQCKELGVNLVIFDDELTGSQTKNIENILEEVKVVDRSSLILDIFALHAKTSEARIMVEIAQMEYTLPRLTRMWTHLCRQVGGIGTRGPGESQLEVDKRLARTRISDLKKRLKKIEASRDDQAYKRNQFHIALAGYTNAGKSTLTNCLTKSKVLVADQLFATLDSTTRKLFLGPGEEVIISDTVGFIRKLPHHLVASFKSTLSVVKHADMIIHLVDSSSRQFINHMEVTENVLNELVDEETPRLLVFNKADAIDEPTRDQLTYKFPEALFVSAIAKEGIEELRRQLVDGRHKWKLKLGLKVPEKRFEFKED